jgi:hypothetical protein
MALKSFDMRKTPVTVQGLPLSGFASGDAVTAEFNEDLWTHEVGADGEVTRVYQGKKDATITIRLGMGSSANTTLSNLARTDELTGFTPVKIAIFDMLIGDIIFGNQCWLMKDPGRTFGQDATAKEWVYTVADLRITHGGGSPLGGV